MNSKPKLMPREQCSTAGIITLLSLPGVQTLSHLTTPHLPHPLLTASTLTPPILLMLNEPYLGTTKVASSAIGLSLDIAPSKGNVMHQVGRITFRSPKSLLMQPEKLITTIQIIMLLWLLLPRLILIPLHLPRLSYTQSLPLCLVSQTPLLIMPQMLQPFWKGRMTLMMK